MYIDLSFPFTSGIGSRIPLDHGYPLFSALSRRDYILHEQPQWALHLVFGEKCPRGFLVHPEFSRVRLRLPVEDIPKALVYRDLGFYLFDSEFRISAEPTIQPIGPTSSLFSPLVIPFTSGDESPEAFEEAFKRDMDKLFEGLPSNEDNTLRWSIGRTRAMKVRGELKRGRSVRVYGLTDAQSILLQEQGVGGRRHMGAGVFSPQHYFPRR